MVILGAGKAKAVKDAGYILKDLVVLKTIIYIRQGKHLTVFAKYYQYEYHEKGHIFNLKE